MKPKRIVSPRLQRSARGQMCQMNVVDVCNFNTDTTVLAHVQTEGGTMGGKCDDFSAVFACSECHKWLDQYLGDEVDRLHYTRRALVRTWRIWIDERLIKI